jgi:hypothetical protein
MTGDFFSLSLMFVLFLFLADPFKAPVDWKALGKWVECVDTKTPFRGSILCTCLLAFISHVHATSSFSLYFCFKMNLGLFDYPQIIKKPMDLGTVKKKIADRKYTSLYQAAEDVRLVWSNCMTYNADDSDFFLLAKNLNKKWEEKFNKFASEQQIDSTALSTGGATGGDKISLDDKRAFAKSLYKISKEDLGKVIVEIDTKCAAALTKNAGEDECELNVDKITPSLFAELKLFVANCGKTQPVKKSKSRKA